MFLVLLAACVVVGVLRLVAATGGAAGRLVRRLIGRLRALWARSDWLGRFTQASGLALVTIYVLTPAAIGTSAWRQRRVLTLTVLAALCALGVVAILGRRLIRRLRRSASDERAWVARELMYADASRENLAALFIEREQYRSPVGQRCWVINQATGEMEDAWFTGQTFPVGSVVLARHTADGAWAGLAWLLPSQLAAAARHEQALAC